MQVMRLVLGLAGLVLFFGFSPALAEEEKKAPETKEDVASTEVIAEKDAVEEPAEKKKSMFTWEPYGFVKLSVNWDDSITDDTDFPTFVLPNDTDDSQLTVDARQTRFGFWVLGPDVLKAATKMNFEFDLTNAGSDTKYLPGIRHAKLIFDWEYFGLEGGQGWDIISPLNPNTVNYTVAWRGGNIGFRRPQLKGFYRQPIGPVTLKTAVGIGRDVGESFLAFGGSDDGGADFSAPIVQGRIGLHGRFRKQSAQLGFSGHFGEEDGGTLGDLKSYSGNMDLMFSLTRCLQFRGEGFYGANLDPVLGGIGQGVNMTLGKEIRSVGGWGQFMLTPLKWLEVNVGAGIDNPLDRDLSAGMRSQNVLAFTNVQFIPHKVFRIQLEYSYWRTSYLAQATADNNRVQFALVYNLPRGY